MTLCGEIVNLVRLNLLHDPHEVRRIGQVAVVQRHMHIGFVRVAVEMIDALSIEQRGPALDTVHLVAFRQQQLREIRTILSRDPGDQCRLAQSPASQADRDLLSYPKGMAPKWRSRRRTPLPARAGVSAPAAPLLACARRQPAIPLRTASTRAAPHMRPWRAQAPLTTPWPNWRWSRARSSPL